MFHKAKFLDLGVLENDRAAMKWHGRIDTPRSLRQRILPSTIGLDRLPSPIESERSNVQKRYILPKQNPFPPARRYGASPKEQQRKEPLLTEGLRAHAELLRFLITVKTLRLSKHASAFTQGNDLPWNQQTLFRFEGAEQAVFSRVLLFKHVNKRSEAAYIPSAEARGFTQPLVKYGRKDSAR